MITRPAVAAALCLTALATHPATLAHAAVYRCETGGEVQFSQFPCSGDARRLALPALPFVHSVPLSDAERRRLEALSRELDRQREAARRSRSRAAAVHERVQRERERRCRQARLALERLARVRRGGYSLEQAARLDAREADLDAEVRSQC